MKGEGSRASVLSRAVEGLAGAGAGAGAALLMLVPGARHIVVFGLAKLVVSRSCFDGCHVPSNGRRGGPDFPWRQMQVGWALDGR